MVFCIEEVNNASWLVTATPTMQEIMILVVQLLDSCLSLEMEQILGEEKAASGVAINNRS